MDTRVFAVKTKKTAPQNNPRVAGGQTVEEEEECDDTEGEERVRTYLRVTCTVLMLKLLIASMELHGVLCCSNFI